MRSLDEQRLPNWILAIAMLVGTLLWIEKLTRGPRYDAEWWIGAAILSIFMLWLVTARLRTEITDGELVVRWSFWRRRTPLREIDRVEAVDYRPIREYGGWGIRYSFKNRGWAYSMSGSRGVRVFLRSGSNLLIGSQRPEELAAAIESARRELS